MRCLSGTGFNTRDVTPLALYEQLSGEGFQDPNSPDWKPDPSIMVRQSVLSAVGEQRKALVSSAGSADMPIGQFGFGGMHTSKPASEVMA